MSTLTKFHVEAMRAGARYRDGGKLFGEMCDAALVGLDAEKLIDELRREREKAQVQHADARRDHVHCMKRADALRAKLALAEAVVEAARPIGAVYLTVEENRKHHGTPGDGNVLRSALDAYDAAQSQGDAPASKEHATETSKVEDRVSTGLSGREVEATQAVAGGTSSPAPSARALSARQRAERLVRANIEQGHIVIGDGNSAAGAYIVRTDHAGLIVNVLRERIAAAITASENAARRALLEELSDESLYMDLVDVLDHLRSKLSALTAKSAEAGT